MNFIETVKNSRHILTEGAITERLRRDPAIKLNENILHAGFIYEIENRRALENLYRQYLDIGQKHELPMIIFTPTWRATEDRIKSAGLEKKDVNGDCARFLASVRESYGAYSEKVFIGGMISSYGDNYKAEEGLTEEEAILAHHFQLEKLTAAGVDFLYASGIPTLAESKGIAKAMEQMGIPYVISFLVRANGELLDGTPLHKAVLEIDKAASVQSLFYMITCVHPINFRSCLNKEIPSYPEIAKRVIGLQANTSSKSPEELNNLKELDSQEPNSFGSLMADLYKDFNCKILGGCCGSDDRHIEAIARELFSISPGSR